MESKKTKIMFLFVCLIYYTIDLALCQHGCNASAAFFLLNTGGTVRVGKDTVANVRLNITQLCLPKYFSVENITAYVVTEQPPERRPFCKLLLGYDGSCLSNNGCSCSAEDRSVSVSRLITQQENWLIVGSNKQWSTGINLTIHILIGDDNATRHQYAITIASITKTTSPTVYKVSALPPTNGTITDASNKIKDDTQRQEEKEPRNKNTPVVPFTETTVFIITVSIVAVMCVMFIVFCIMVCITGKRDKATFLKGRNSAVVSRASGLLALLRLGGLPPVPELTEVPTNCVSTPQRAGSSQPILSGSSKPASKSKALKATNAHMEVLYNNMDTTDFLYAKVSEAATPGQDRPTASSGQDGTISAKSEYSNVSKPKKSSRSEAEVTSPAADDQRVSSASVLDWPAPPVPLPPLTSDVTEVHAVTRIASNHLGVGAHAHLKPINYMAGLKSNHTPLEALASETLVGSHAKQAKDNLKTDGVGYLVPYATVIPEDSC